MTPITRAQREALARVFQRRDPIPEINRSAWLRRYRAFRRTAWIAYGDCVMVKWAGMMLGIERDGYTHS